MMIKSKKLKAHLMKWNLFYPTWKYVHRKGYLQFSGVKMFFLKVTMCKKKKNWYEFAYIFIKKLRRCPCGIYVEGKIILMK